MTEWHVERHNRAVVIRKVDGFLQTVAICPNENATWEADARLIAAAPELLVQTKLLERSLIYEIKKSFSEGDEEGARMKALTLGLVREVLDKAEGKP